MRVAEDVSRFAAIRGQDRFRAKTGLPLSTYFSGLKLRWILQNVPGARERAATGDALFGNIDSWLLWNLTGGTRGGVHVTDVTNASRTQLLNLSTLDWDDELLAAFEIPRRMLPRVCSSSEIYGSATLPLISGVPIAGDLGDQQAALVRQTCFPPGPCSRPLRIKRAKSWKRWKRMRRSDSARCESMAAWLRTNCSCNSRPTSSIARSCVP